MFTGTTDTAKVAVTQVQCSWIHWLQNIDNNLPINVEKHPKRPDHTYAYHTIKMVATAVTAAATDDVVIIRA